MKTNNKRQVTAKKTSSKSSHGRKACQCGICCLEPAPKACSRQPCALQSHSFGDPWTETPSTYAWLLGTHITPSTTFRFGVSPRVQRRDCKFPIAASTTTLSSSSSSSITLYAHNTPQADHEPPPKRQCRWNLLFCVACLRLSRAAPLLTGKRVHRVWLARCIT